MSIGRRADVKPLVPGGVIPDGARSLARRARFVHRMRANRIEMAETIMTQRKKIKTVTWTEHGTHVHWPVLFILGNVACTSHVLLETTRLAVVACTGFVLLVTARSGVNSFRHSKD